MVQRICKYCHQTYETKLGLNNWKNLFRKPTMDDWIVLIILILLFAASFAYITETKACRETLGNSSKFDELCRLRQNQVNYTWNGVPMISSLNYTVKNETIINNDDIDKGSNLTLNKSNAS